MFYLIVFLMVCWFIYEYFYYKSKKFMEIKNSIQEYTQKCNDLNDHIEELKRAYINIKKIDFGEAQLIDNSRYTYKRPKLKNYLNNENIHNCSLAICKGAKDQPFKYLCKYFNINTDEDTLSNFENVLNDFSAAEQGKILLKRERDGIIKNISEKIPSLIKILSKKKLIKKLGFDDIDFSQLYFPKYTFKYVSGGGNSSMHVDIIFNIDNLDRFITYLSDIVKFKKSVEGQRALMTSQLREKIKIRDNYTCKYCGLSTQQEPNLLLEIDHIIPLSKNGLTTEDNLQTLCWKCNRSKSNKLI